MKKVDFDQVKECIKDLGGECISKEYVNSKEKLELICPLCKSHFLRNFDNIKNRGKVTCSKCSRGLTSSKQAFTYEYVDSVIRKNGCELIDKEYKNSDSKIEIKCKCGNHFSTTFYKFTKRNKKQCKSCGYKIIKEKKLTPKEDIIEYLEGHNYKYIDRDTSKGKDQRVLIQCDKNHDPYWVAFNKFKSSGRRCPNCVFSRGEKYIEDILNKHNIEFKKEFKFKDLKGIGGLPLRYDFCILEGEEIKVLIEYDGRQHFEVSYDDEEGFKRTQKHDQLKNDYAENNSIDLYRIHYEDFENIPEIIEKILL